MKGVWSVNWKSRKTKRVMDLDLPEHDRMIINDYIACLQTVDLNYSRNSI